MTGNKKLYLKENILINLIFLWESFISALKSAWTLYVSNNQAVLQPTAGRTYFRSEAFNPEDSG